MSKRKDKCNDCRHRDNTGMVWLCRECRKENMRHYCPKGLPVERDENKMEISGPLKSKGADKDGMKCRAKI